MGDTASGNFELLAGGKGYVTRPEAVRDPWLSRNFQRCDRNQNNEVSRIEYQVCHHNHDRH